MIVTRYKPLFSVAAKYQVAAGPDVYSNGMSVAVAGTSDEKMSGLKLKPIAKDNMVMVYFEGHESPVAAPVISEPSLEIMANEYFYFGVDISGKEKLKPLKFHTTAALAKETGFPLLYDAFVKAGSIIEIKMREEVKVVPPVFTFTAIASATGIAGDYASLEVRDENDVLQSLDMQPVQLNDKAIDGAGAVPEFAFSVDATKLETGVYELKVGTFKKKFFIAQDMDVSNIVALIRVLKNNFLAYKKNLGDNSFAQFELKIPLA